MNNECLIKFEIGNKSSLRFRAVCFYSFSQLVYKKVNFSSLPLFLSKPFPEVILIYRSLPHLWLTQTYHKELNYSSDCKNFLLKIDPWNTTRKSSINQCFLKIKSEGLWSNSVTHCKAVLSRSRYRLAVSTKPILGGGFGCFRASEFSAEAISIPTKVVFTWHCTRPRRLKLTVSGCTVNMQSPFIKTLPERCRQIRAHVSPDVDVFHFLALAFSSEIKDVEVFEVSPKVISKIDTFYRVAACCSPVSRLAL